MTADHLWHYYFKQLPGFLHYREFLIAQGLIERCTDKTRPTHLFIWYGLHAL